MDKIDDYYRLRYQASEEGLDVKDFLHRQRLSGISLDQAIENANKGVTTSEYISKKRQKEKLNNLGLISAFGAAAIYIASILTLLPSGEQTRDVFEGSNYLSFEEYYKENWRKIAPAFGH